MPDPIVVTTDLPDVSTAPVAPVAPPPASTPAEPGGSSDFEAEIGELMRPKTPAKPDAPTAVGKKAAPVKPDAAKPVDPWADPKLTAPDLRKRLQEVHGEVGRTKAEKQVEIDKLNAKITDLDKRKYLTPEQEKRQADMETRVKSLEAELYARDWSQSNDFKSKYEEKFTTRAKQAVSDVGKLVVKTTDPETGEVKQRQATTADWMRVYNAQDNIEARRVARELFGEDSDIMLEHRNKMNELREAADNEVADKRKEWEAKKVEEQTSYKVMSEKFDTTRSQFDEQLVKQYPELFGEDPENPEANEAMKKGLAYVDSSVEEADKMPIESRAMRAATLRRWASVTPKLLLLREKDKAEIAALKEELGKYKKTDPGNIGEAGGAAPKEEVEGSDSLAAMLPKGK